ncbi:MAG: histidine kinase dimerization/phosphoacceptor domain -containing protein [bacterium]
MEKEKGNIKLSIRVNFIWLGVFFSVFYWTLESIRDVVTFERGTFFERFFIPDVITIWMRLLIVFIIMLFSAYVQSLKNKAYQQKTDLEQVLTNVKHIWISIGFGALYWVLESFRDAEVLKFKNIINQIFLPSAEKFFMRILAVCVLVLFSIYIKNLIDARKKAEKQLRDLKDKFVSKKQEEADLLKQMNQSLREKLQLYETKRKELEKNLKLQRNSILIVHHQLRVTTQNLLRLFETKYSETEDKGITSLLTEIKTQLYTLSLIYSRQYKEQNSNRIKFKTYLEDLIKYLSSSNYIHTLGLFMDNEILLPIQQAAPISLVLNELMQFSFKKLQAQNDIKLFIQKPDEELMIKIRHSDKEAWQGFDEKNKHFQWVKNIIEDNLNGNSWIARSKFAELNIILPVKR